MWIYKSQDWPNFEWDMDSLSANLAEIRYQQGILLGKMESLGFDLKSEANLKMLTNDVIKSSKIEGEILNPEEVRSSIARRLGFKLPEYTPVGRDVDGIVEMMLDATQNHTMELTKERLFSWHAALFPTGRSGMHKINVGKWRTPESGPMQVVSGAVGKERIHFEAPSAIYIENEMQIFLNWFDSANNLDPVMKAGIAHLWFITIHPFEDGNGRIARAISDMTLARADQTRSKFYSLSSQIEAERKSYYSHLEIQQKGSINITNWLRWFINCFGKAIAASDKTLSKIVYKSKLWSKLNLELVNERQRLIVNKMFEDDFKGSMNTSKYAKLAKCSNDTALRDIQTLKAKGFFIQNPGGGRSTSYRLLNDKEVIK